MSLWRSTTIHNRWKYRTVVTTTNYLNGILPANTCLGVDKIEKVPGIRILTFEEGVAKIREELDALGLRFLSGLPNRKIAARMITPITTMVHLKVDASIVLPQGFLNP